MKVYILTDGQYDDLRVMGVFTTREKAEKYKEAAGFNESPQICKFELDPTPIWGNQIKLQIFKNGEVRTLWSDWVHNPMVKHYFVSVVYQGKLQTALEVTAPTNCQERATQLAKSLHENLISGGKWKDDIS